MVAERVPGQLCDLAMVLVRVVAAMRKDDVGRSAPLELLEAVFELWLIGEVAVAELEERDLAVGCTL